MDPRKNTNRSNLFGKRGLWLSVTLLTAVTGSVTGWYFLSKTSSRSLALHEPQEHSIKFSEEFPSDPKFQNELKEMLNKGEIQRNDEELIRLWTITTAEDLGIPPSVLWCLFFQESRLNHLSGLNSNRPAKGLGQFLRPSFFEVNHHLDRYTSANSHAILKRMGKDIRPVRAKLPKKLDLTSYYFIPTAVLSSAGYLNSRYHQLDRNLKSRGITPDPTLLWLYAVMAYNKGARSVFAFWNEAYRKGGVEKVKRLVTDVDAFSTAVASKTYLRRSLGQIWTGSQAERFAEELRIHLKNVDRCSRAVTASKDTGAL